jgi:acetyl-CoA decarbonylase/synthase complex subunit epsilon
MGKAEEGIGMSVKEPSWIAEYLSGKKVLLLAGALCDQIDFGDKKLLDYAAEIAKALDVPVAATGNTVIGFRERGIDTRKAWAAEIINYMQFDEWLDPVMDGKPEILVFMGYSPMHTQKLICAVKNVETVTLGNMYIKEATYSFPDASLSKWQKGLAELIQASGVRA